jgi:para-nitrobenzyl esterase
MKVLARARTKSLQPFLLLALPSFITSQPLVNTTSGLLRGFTPYPNIYAYLGIPYAQPSIDALRFAPPQPYKPTNSSTRDCYDVSPGCFQLTYSTAFADRSTGIAESEDMMSINIVCLIITSR